MYTLNQVDKTTGLTDTTRDLFAWNIENELSYLTEKIKFKNK